MTDDLTHLDQSGDAHMVDVSEKRDTQRAAAARGFVYFSADTLDTLRTADNKKGDVLGTARLAGIMAAKQTGALIPLCHPLPLTHVDVMFAWLPDEQALAIDATARCVGKTGVEMEALAAVTLAALTIFDMCKAIDRSMSVGDIHVRKKSGGRSGDWTRDDPPGPVVGDDTNWT